MKFLAALIMILPLAIQAQQKKDTKIIAAITDTTDLFKRLQGIIYDKGFTIEESNEAVGFLMTKEKKLSRWDAYVKVKARIRGNTIEFTGLFKVPQLGPDFDPVEFVGMKGSIYKDSWKEMEEVAKEFGSLTYSK